MPDDRLSASDYKKVALVVPRARTREALVALRDAGLLDPTRRIQSDTETALPARADPRLHQIAAALDGRIEETDLAPRDTAPTPFQEIRARLAHALPTQLLDDIPNKWEKLGDVAIIRLPPTLADHGPTVARAFAEILDVRCVLEDREGVAGEYREMAANTLWGHNPIATHIENGITYRFDASRIMFSSGNVAERTRAATLPATGETIIDMFAGIGYFTLPLAVHAGAARIHAIEKNPASHQWLIENARLNNVTHIIQPTLGDNRNFPHDGTAHRVMMGYVGGTHAFLPKGLALLRPEGGAIHFHDTAPATTWRRDFDAWIQQAAHDASRTATIQHARVVKSYAPGIVHAVADVRVT